MRCLWPLALCLALAGVPATAHGHWPQAPYPGPGALAAAQAFAAARGAAFAVAEPSGRVRGHAADQSFSSASSSKALLMAAELRRLRRGRETLDPTTRTLLRAMITWSDNAAADAIYARVGDHGLAAVARDAGMIGFTPIPGFWGGAQVTAADLARFYIRLGRNLRGPGRPFARRLLAQVISDQRWGLPVGAGPRWRIWFKGGWRPAQEDEEGTSGPATHQAGLLRHASGARVAIAVLSKAEPGATSFGTIAGIAARLLGKPPAPPPAWPAL